VLPRAMIPEISNIKREYARMDLGNMFLPGFFRFGSYSASEKAITLFTLKNTSPGNLTKNQQQVYHDTLIHELAHANFSKMLPKEAAEWEKISHADERVITDEIKKGFLFDIEILQATYTKVLDCQESDWPSETFIEEDFCEHMAYFVNHGAEFRKAAESSDTLRLKYEYIAQFIESKAGARIEYIGAPLAQIRTIEEERKKVLIDINNIGLKERIDIDEEQFRDKETEAIAEREAVVPSIEACLEDDADKARRGHVSSDGNPDYQLVMRELDANLSEDYDIAYVDPEQFYEELVDGPKHAVDYLVHCFPTMEQDYAKEIVEYIRESLEFEGESKSDSDPFLRSFNFDKDLIDTIIGDDERDCSDDLFRDDEFDDDNL
jgi:hypothetical protein